MNFGLLVRTDDGTAIIAAIDPKRWVYKINERGRFSQARRQERRHDRIEFDESQEQRYIPRRIIACKDDYSAAVYAFTSHPRHAFRNLLGEPIAVVCVSPPEERRRIFFS